jgi:hypothetical protein
VLGDLSLLTINFILRLAGDPPSAQERQCLAASASRILSR